MERERPAPFARSFPPSIEHLQLLVAMADVVSRANQEVFREAFPDRAGTPESVGSQTSTVLAYNIYQVLSGLADKEASGETLSSEQRAVLDSYLRSREEWRAPTAALIEDYAAHDSVDPEALLEALADPSLLDFYSWRYAGGLGRFMQPRETRAQGRMEREALAFAEALCAAAGQQPAP